MLIKIDDLKRKRMMRHHGLADCSPKEAMQVRRDTKSDDFKRQKLATKFMERVHSEVGDGAKNMRHFLKDTCVKKSERAAVERRMK